MTLKQKTLLASLSLAVVCLPACTHKIATQRLGLREDRVFKVRLYTDPANSKQCSADLSAVTLWKNKHHTVQWISDDGNAYLVDFSKPEAHSGSPFADPSPTFLVPANGVKASGDLSPNSQTGKYYDYAIHAGTDINAPVCKTSDDPGLYVK